MKHSESTHLKFHISVSCYMHYLLKNPQSETYISGNIIDQIFGKTIPSRSYPKMLDIMFFKLSNYVSEESGFIRINTTK